MVSFTSRQVDCTRLMQCARAQVVCAKIHLSQCACIKCVIYYKCDSFSLVSSQSRRRSDDRIKRVPNPECCLLFSSNWFILTSHARTPIERIAHRAYWKVFRCYKSMTSLMAKSQFQLNLQYKRPTQTMLSVECLMS